MKLKKKIIRQSYDYKAEKDYYKEAAVCPNCGNSKRFLPTADETGNLLSIVEHRLHASTDIEYECKKCGCCWRVRGYKG